MNNNNDDGAGTVFLFGFLLGGVLCFLAGISVTQSYWKRQAIQHEVAHYIFVDEFGNKKFQWKNIK